jgi:hypothetical protein
MRQLANRIVSWTELVSGINPGVIARVSNEDAPVRGDGNPLVWMLFDQLLAIPVEQFVVSSLEAGKQCDRIRRIQRLMQFPETPPLGAILFGRNPVNVSLSLSRHQSEPSLKHIIGDVQRHLPSLRSDTAGTMRVRSAVSQ